MLGEVKEWSTRRVFGRRPELAAAAPWRRRTARSVVGWGPACRERSSGRFKGSARARPDEGQRGQAGPRQVRRRAEPYHGGQGGYGSARFRGVPAVRGTLGHGQPGEHARGLGNVRRWAGSRGAGTGAGRRGGGVARERPNCADQLGSN
jgi:hypothetical protein